MNPEMIIKQAMMNSQYNQNPIFRSAVDMYKIGDRRGLENLAKNLCRENGVNPEDVFRKFGMK